LLLDSEKIPCERNLLAIFCIYVKQVGPKRIVLKPTDTALSAQESWGHKA
jgi:hypothetical protein